MSLRRIIVTLLLLTPLYVVAQVAATKPYFHDRTIIAKGDKQFAPFEFINEQGEPDGFSVELFRALMERLKIKYTLSLEDWGEVQQQLNDKQIDLAIGMIYSKERAEKVKFGIPHCMISYNIICRKDNDFVDLESLRGKEIIVQIHDRAHGYLLESGLTNKIITVDNIENAINLLASGKYDAVISFDVSSFYFVRKGGFKNLRVHLTDLPPEKYSIVVNTDNEELLYLLNSAIYQMKIDGEYDRIYYKWFGVYEKTGVDKVVWYILAALGVVSVILIIFIRLLRIKVNTATRDIKAKNEELLRENLRRQQMEMRLIEAKEKAEESDRLKSAFLANMSHEIRTPLNAIVGFSSIICQTDDITERESFHEIITKNNELLLQLINDILDLSKIESGIMLMNRIDFNIEEVCEQVFSSISCTMKNKEVKLIKDTDFDCMVNSDRARITQVVTNFMTNAIKFSPHGSITLATRQLGDKVEISVTDTGIGIEPDKLNSVFERFVKLNAFSQGTGLGLSICKNIMDKLDGEIGVESQVGEGSKFWIRLRIVEPRDE